MMESPEGPAAVDQLVAAITPSLSAFSPEVQNAARAWKISGVPGRRREVRWPVAGRPLRSRSRIGPIQKEAPLEAQQSAFRRVNSEYGRSLKFGGNIGSLNDKQLKQEHDALVGVLSAIRRNPDVVQATNEQGADVRRRSLRTFYDSAAPDRCPL